MGKAIDEIFERFGNDYRAVWNYLRTLPVSEHFTAEQFRKHMEDKMSKRNMKKKKENDDKDKH